MSLIRKDYQAYGLNMFSLLKGAFTGHTFYAVMWYRLSSWLFRHRVRLLPEMVGYVNRFFFGCEISPAAKFGGGLKILHSNGIVVGYQAIVGEFCELYQGVTIGSNRKPIDGREMPIIGDNVTIASGAVVIGAIRVGDRVIIGANSVVTHDVASNVVVAGVPAQVVKSQDQYMNDRK